MRKTVRLTCAGLFCAIRIMAQEPQIDSVPVQESIRAQILRYEESAGDMMRLNNGPLYPGYPFPIVRGHQYFKSNKPVRGSLTYRGLYYDQVPLIYDEIQESLIYQGSVGRIVLRNADIAEFELHQQKFIQPYPPLRGAALPEGWYQLLADGKASFLKKEKKRMIEETSVDRGLEHVVATDYYYYAFSGGQYHSIRNSKSLLRFLRKQDASFNYKSSGSRNPSDPESEWLDIIRQFNHRKP